MNPNKDFGTCECPDCKTDGDSPDNVTMPMPGPVPVDDPWAHRSKGMRCKTCMWFAGKPAAGIRITKDMVTRLGRCRRRAPTMNGYPAVYENDWCGDHKLDETKI